MTDSTLLLGLIAFATVVMALVQIGIVWDAVRLAGRINRLIDTVEEELKPTLSRVNSMSADLARVTVLASEQSERLNKLLASVSRQIDNVVSLTQDSFLSPARQGGVLFVAIRAALAAFRSTSESSRSESTSGGSNTPAEERTQTIS